MIAIDLASSARWVSIAQHYSTYIVPMPSSIGEVRHLCGDTSSRKSRELEWLKKVSFAGSCSYLPAGGVAPSGFAAKDLNVPWAFTHAERGFLR